MRQLFVLAFAAASLLSITSSRLDAHCQIPCGIYDDNLRFSLLRENVTTIEKSMNQIVELSAAAPRNDNQITRWVMNKDAHADALTEIVTAYFLAQRIAPVDASDAHAFEDCNAKLRALHGMIVEAMKAKQTTDLAHVAALRGLIDEFQSLYAHKH